MGPQPRHPVPIGDIVVGHGPQGRLEMVFVVLLVLMFIYCAVGWVLFLAEILAPSVPSCCKVDFALVQSFLLPLRPYLQCYTVFVSFFLFFPSLSFHFFPFFLFCRGGVMMLTMA